MPVLMVSLNTCPQPGFSKKRSIVPSSRVMTIPNSSGFSTEHSAMVASASFFSWNSTTDGQVDVGEHVARDHQEALGQLLAGVAHRPGRAERRLLGGVDHAHAELAAVAEVVADGVGEEGHRDDDVGDAVAPQQRHDVLHHRAAHQRQHRLGQVRGLRAQPGALAARHDHGLHTRRSVSSPARALAPAGARAGRGSM